MTLVEQRRPKRGWLFLLIAGSSFLLSMLLSIGIIYFREGIQQIGGYGYAGVFFVGVLCGITIIPVPTVLMVFTFGAILNPVYVGLVAGLGGALGGITVYLTGAGLGTMWSMYRPERLTLGHQPGKHHDIVESVLSRFWSRSRAFYNRIVSWVGGYGGAWVVFIASVLIISPFYFAGLAAGSLRMGLPRFFLISWTGKTVRYLFVASAGYWGLNSLLRWIGV